MSVTVKTQAELNAALAAKADIIYVDSPAGVWLYVSATDSSSVVAGAYVAVHLHSQHVTLSGGVAIDLTKLDLTDPATWCEFHGVTVQGGNAILYKAVDKDWCAGHAHKLTMYEPGTTVTAPDWIDSGNCGNGLHICPTPMQARDHYPSAARFVEVSVPVVSLRPIDESKCKAPTVVVLREVDLWRDEVTR